MTYEEFKDVLRDEIQKKLKETKVDLQEVPGHLHTIGCGIMISCPDREDYFINNIGNYFEGYKKGISVEEIVNDICLGYRHNCMEPLLLEEDRRIYERIKDRLTYHIINENGNKDFLKDVPYIKWQEFAIVFYITKLQEVPYALYSMLVKGEDLRIWGISKETLYQDALQSTQRRFPAVMENLQEIMRNVNESFPDDTELAAVSEYFKIMGAPDIMVLSNQVKKYGASVILYDKLLSGLAQMLGHSFFILLTMHEALLIDDTYADQSEVRQWHRDACCNLLPQEDWLSDEIYMFDQDKNEIIWIPEDINCS